MMNSENTKKVVKVRMFGRFVIQIGDRSFDVDSVRSGKVCKILAYLMYHYNHPVQHSELIDLFVSDETDNPYSTLKNLVYRMRNILHEYFPDEDLIVTSSGSYSISPKYEIELDAKIFEDDCKKTNEYLPEVSKVKYYKEIVSLYEGAFLPKQESEMWIIPLSSYFHNLYIATLKQYIYYLEEKMEYAEMSRLCVKGLNIDNLDEELYLLSVQALVHQGKDAQALNQYYKATEIIYNELGTRPSDAMNEMYQQLNKSKQSEKSIIEIQNELMSSQLTKRGAYFCEYGVFKEIYSIFIKWCQRYGMSFYMVQFTVSCRNLKTERKIEETTQAVMEQLKDAMISNLRQGDVVTRFSNTQLLALLPTCTQETSKLVIERILMRYTQKGKVKNTDIHFSMIPIGTSEETIWRGRVNNG